jgi:predicted HNH restriction endonuclease
MKNLLLYYRFPSSRKKKFEYKSNWDQLAEELYEGETIEITFKKRERNMELYWKESTK